MNACKKFTHCLNKGKYFSLRGRISRKIDFARGDGKRRPTVQEANFEILNFYLKFFGQFVRNSHLISRKKPYGV